ncbi:integrase catalytic domain-containing protein [Trichonephila clavata]|uniref:Integrase catalytic domain-containing protein n=1 Tax=Trichonephila clavata TaxID=2740835 RepID=A0A8X6F2D6_TRICU|nr:integrase catalytic domain-containing protein [Trichonephila clavata]
MSIQMIIEHYDVPLEVMSMHLRMNVEKSIVNGLSNWIFVKGEQNSSDIVPRGSSVEELLKNRRLWHGPHWLTLSKENWRKSERLSQETTNEERRVKYIAIRYTSEFQTEEPILDINDVSSMSKAFRISAWTRRFINDMKLKKIELKTPLQAEEIKAAEEIRIKKVQAENFGIESNCLKDKYLLKYSKIRDLNPFPNEKGIVRISGRLHQSALSYHEKHPLF